MHWIEKMRLTIKDDNGDPISLYEFNKRCGFPNNFLKKLLDANTPIGNIGLTTADSIAEALGITFIEFWDRYYPNKKESNNDSPM